MLNVTLVVDYLTQDNVKVSLTRRTEQTDTQLSLSFITHVLDTLDRAVALARETGTVRLTVDIDHAVYPPATSGKITERSAGDI